MLRLDPTAFGARATPCSTALEAEGIPCSAGYGFSLPAAAVPQQGVRSVSPGRRAIGWTTAAGRCPNSDLICTQSIWLEHSLLLGTADDMDEIAPRVREDPRHRDELDGRDDRAPDTARWAALDRSRNPYSAAIRAGMVAVVPPDDRWRPVHDRREPAGSRLGRARAPYLPLLQIPVTATFGVLAIVACLAIAYDLGRSFESGRLRERDDGGRRPVDDQLRSRDQTFLAMDSLGLAGCSPRSWSRS